MPKRTIGVLLKTRFAGATREEMSKVYEEKMGVAPAPSLTDDEVRAELVLAFGLAKATMEPPHSDDAVAAPIIAGVPKKTPLGAIPNLGQTGKWGGRKRLVTFHKMSDKQEVQPLGWNGLIWYAPLGQRLEVPWPYWYAAQNCKLWDTGSDDVTRWVKTRDGRLEKHVTPVAKDTIRYEDHGDVPGTEDLPIDYLDFFRRKAEETKMFAGFGRALLVMIFNYLHEPQPMWYFRDMRDEDVRIRIAQTLGTPFEQMLQNELWDAATA